MSTFLIFFLTLVLAVVFPARPAFAHDAPAIVPTRLDFDGSQASKNCDDDVTFSSILGMWVTKEVLIPDADRRLVVRIRRSPTGQKLADLTLLDAAGTTITQEHKTFASNTECHRVLWEAALAAATLLGAFDKPPPPEPCPISPPPPPPVEPLPCPACPASSPSSPQIERPRPSIRMVSVAAGVFLGTGITPVGTVGPFIAARFALSPHMRRVQFEMAGTWASQTLPKSNAYDSLHLDMVPLVLSLCYSRYGLRICSGLATTFYSAERPNLVPGNDQFRMTLGANVQIGTEFTIAGPLSIRVDVFGRLQFWQPTYGNEWASLDAQNVFASGVIAMGVWSFEWRP